MMMLRRHSHVQRYSSLSMTDWPTGWQADYSHNWLTLSAIPIIFEVILMLMITQKLVTQVLMVEWLYFPVSSSRHIRIKNVWRIKKKMWSFLAVTRHTRLQDTLEEEKERERCLPVWPSAVTWIDRYEDRRCGIGISLCVCTRKHDINLWHLFPRYAHYVWESLKVSLDWALSHFQSLFPSYISATNSSL